MTRRPASASRSRNSSFTSTGSTADSFCRPSRAPTSQMVTSAGSAPGSGAATTVGRPSSRAPTSALLLVPGVPGRPEVVVGIVVDLAVEQRVHVLHVRDVVELQRLVGRGLDDQRAGSPDPVDQAVLEAHAVD